MSIKVIFCCLLFTQTSASFFDEFRGAMASVETSFEKLLSDVVVDVQETIGCTILAVKQVLSLGGIYHESSDYDSRCRGVNRDTTKYQDNYSPPILQSESNGRPLPEQVSAKIEESVSDPHNTMFDLIDDKGAYKSIVKAKASIAHERDRLSEISALLRRELGSISEDVKRELRKVDTNANHPTADAILHNIKSLHEIELNHKNSHEAAEIHHILNEIVCLLHGDDLQNQIPTSQTVTETESETNDAFLEIENQFGKMEENEKKTKNFENESNKTSDKKDTEQKPEDLTSSFEGVANKIMEETSRTFRLADGTPQQYESVAPTTTEKSIATEKYVEDPEDNSSLFQLAPADSPAHEDAILEATKLIEQSKQHDAILNDYFKKTENIGTSVFDDSAFLDFA